MNTLQNSSVYCEKLLDNWLSDTSDIERKIQAQLRLLLTDIKNEYDNTVDMFYGEIDTDRETNYYIESFFKLDTDNNVIHCYRSDKWIVRLVYECDMISIDELVQDLALDLDDHIKLPKYQKFLDYLESTRYYYRDNNNDDYSIHLARQSKILSEYVITIDDMCLDDRLQVIN